MVVEVAKNAKEEKVREAVKKITAKTKKDASKFFGKLKDGVDGLAYQKKARNEWK